MMVETGWEMLDRAESVLRRHLTPLPAGTRQAVEREVLALLQMARAALPRELQQATRLVQEAEVTLARAREEARRIVLDAESRARTLADSGPPGGPALRGQALLDEARREAERIRQGADEYAATVLQRLEVEVTRVLGTIRRGQEALRTGSTVRRSE
jgi:vacuolar-type H+-ATPase subunit H